MLTGRIAFASRPKNLEMSIVFMKGLTAFTGFTTAQLCRNLIAP
jgi:hypothetical protein